VPKPELIFNVAGVRGREGDGGDLLIAVGRGPVLSFSLEPEEAAILGAHLQGWAVQHGVICETVLTPIKDGGEGGEPEMIAREDAIRALDALFEQAFGHDKGSGEVYEAWCAEQGLCEEWDGEEDPIPPECEPPCQHELMLALGLTPQEILDALHINPRCFPANMCAAYGMEPPAAEEGSSPATAGSEEAS
jgi:hypothetical protein